MIYIYKLKSHLYVTDNLIFSFGLELRQTFICSEKEQEFTLKKDVAFVHYFLIK